jgi:signal transduction histidine kinase
MDLHDEMGSALGAIGILAGLATGDLAEADRRKMTAKIADTAEDLGESLGDIVWSLREGSATLDTLVAHIRERAARLFPDGKQLAFELPDTVPPIRLSLPVCGNVQRIALEALHNAARHAAAKRVVLGLAADGKRWRLWIEDNGVGIAPDLPRGRRGLGLTSMRRRAKEIDASITIDAPKGGGTRITIVFDPGAEDVRIVRPSHDRAKDVTS